MNSEHSFEARVKQIPVISVIVTTYNHEKYISQCLDSILSQKDSPSFEIIIGNDCSTDGTAQIINNYAQKYDIIKVLPRETNIGMQNNLKECFAHCSGEYIAICEGDDYFCDDYNLKKKYDALQNDLQASMVFSDIYLYFQDTKKLIPHAVDVKSRLDTRITTVNIINPFNIIGNFSCCMYRKSTVVAIPESYYVAGNADWLFNLYALELSHGVFLKEYLSVYRLHSASLYSSISSKNQALGILKSCWTYNKIFQGKYSAEFFQYAYERTANAFETLELEHKSQKTLLQKFFCPSSLTYKNGLERIFSIKDYTGLKGKYKIITLLGCRLKVKTVS